jgi:hypothetical protein
MTIKHRGLIWYNVKRIKFTQEFVHVVLSKTDVLKLQRDNAVFEVTYEQE